MTPTDAAERSEAWTAAELRGRSPVAVRAAVYRFDVRQRHLTEYADRVTLAGRPVATDGGEVRE